MLKFVVDGIISSSIILLVVFLVLGNIMRFVWWMKQREKRKSMGIQYYYLDFWGKEIYEYTNAEIENLHHKLQQFEEREALHQDF